MAHFSLASLLSTARKLGLSGSASQMAWSFMLALFPSLILLVAGLDLLPLEKRLDSVTSDLISGVSPEVAELLSTFIVDFAHHRPSAGIFLWLIPALWASSRGVRAARQGLQKIYGVAPKGRWLPTRLLDLLWSALALILTGLGFLALILGPQLLEFFGSFLRLETFFSYLSTYFRWPFIFLFLSTISCLAIRILPGAPLTGKAWLSGSALTLGCWLLLGLSFRFWLEHLGHFEKIYGSLASFFILMFLLWLISWTLLLGGLLAANLHPSAASKES